jgi:hypothetical protein
LIKGCGKHFGEMPVTKQAEAAYKSKKADVKRQMKTDGELYCMDGRTGGRGPKKEGPSQRGENVEFFSKYPHGKVCI